MKRRGQDGPPFKEGSCHVVERMARAASQGVDLPTPWDRLSPRAQGDWRRAMRAALAALGPEYGGWQPIETAPKDGTPLLLAIIDPWGNLGFVEHGHFEIVEQDEDDIYALEGGDVVCKYQGRPAGTYWNCWYSADEFETHYRVDDSKDFRFTHWRLATAVLAPSLPEPEGNAE